MCDDCSSEKISLFSSWGFSCVLWKKVAFRRFRCALFWFVFSSLSLSRVPTDFEEEQWPLHQFPTGGLMAI